jgi:hypothetical protein
VLSQNSAMCARPFLFFVHYSCHLQFYRLIPADLQLLLPPQRAPSAETLEGPIEYPVLVRGVRMTARLYRGDNALEVSLPSACPTNVITPNSSGAMTSIFFPASGKTRSPPFHPVFLTVSQESINNAIVRILRLSSSTCSRVSLS